MLHKILIVPILFCCQFVLAQTVVNNLKYKYTTTIKSNKGDYIQGEGKVNFNWDGENKLLVADKTKNFDQKPRIILDLNRRVMVVEMPNSEYILEETDSLFQYHDKLERTENTQILQGYKCTQYVYKRNDTITAAIGKPVFNIEYSVWTTEELAWGDAANTYIYGLLKGVQPTTAFFKGVVVQFEYSNMSKGQGESTVYALDTNRLNRTPEKITWPWQTTEGTAWIEGDVFTANYAAGKGYTGNNHSQYRKGDGTLKKHNARLIALLQRITGQAEPKTKRWIFGDIFW